MSDTIENLRKYNLWRRGDELIEQPDPKDIGIWIDEICEIAEKLERERDEAREERDKMQTELEMWRDGNILHEVHRDELEKTERERNEARINAITAKRKN
jgi:hypothetical protein